MFHYRFQLHQLQVYDVKITYIQYIVILNITAFFLTNLFSVVFCRLDEQLYLERYGILRPPLFPPIPPSYMYMRYPQDILPSPIGLISPVMHERWDTFACLMLRRYTFFYASKNFLSIIWLLNTVYNCTITLPFLEL